MQRFLHAGDRYVQSSSLDPTSIHIKKPSSHYQPHSTNLGRMLNASTFAKVTRAFALVALFCLIAMQGAEAQTTQKSRKAPKYYQIGDKLPKSLVIGTLLEDSTKVITMKDYRGKAVILDFWATYCGTCIANFPLVDSIGKAYHKNLQVVLLHVSTSRENRGTVQNFMKGYQKKHPLLDLPVIMIDLATKKRFFVPTIPHYIWVDANGRIKAITYSDELTNYNIQDLVAGRNLNLEQKGR